MNNLFRNLFPNLTYFKKINAKTFKWSVLFYLNPATKMIEIWNYYIKRTFTGINNNLKKILNSNAIPNFEKLQDIGDLFADNDVALSDSDIDFLPNSKVELEDKILG